MKNLTTTNKKYINQYGAEACKKAYNAHLDGQGAYESAYKAGVIPTNCPANKGRIIGDGLINAGRALSETK